MILCHYGNNNNNSNNMSHLTATVDVVDGSMTNILYFTCSSNHACIADYGLYIMPIFIYIGVRGGYSNTTIVFHCC